MASSKETYCLCGQPYNIGQFMIECDCCREWFHGSCVDVKIYQSDDIDKYHCPKCAQTYGPSVLKTPTNNHRADRYELGAESRPAQAGSPAWVRALAARPPRPLPAALQPMRGQHFTEEFVRDNGFTRPVMFHSAEGLDMKVPNSATFTARSVLRYCGAQLEVEVIDVRKQTTLRMPLGEFVEYFEAPVERRADKVLNVISLEFSDTNMSPLVEPPLTARRLDWAERVWPGAAERPPRPAVQKYCLLSAGGAYTDWHVDFGGTTVWYHVLHGKKIFYLAPPTATNLALYQQWTASNNQSERFFGDMVEWYGTAELRAGETLMIPSGWLHAVMTPRDSIVLGGNLLHHYAIETQLQIYEIERRVETPMMFRYPLFEAMHWYAGAHLLTALRRHNEESQDEDFTLGECDVRPPPVALAPLLLRGVKILANALKEWHALKSTDAAKRDNVPKCLNSGQLVRELCKELRTLEKRTSASHRDIKRTHASPNKSHARRPAAKKSLKLTLPKPIMHIPHNAQNNGEYVDDKMYEKVPPYVEENKDIVYQDPRYITQDIKYTEQSLQEAKTFIVDGKEIVMSDKGYVYQTYDEELPVYGQENSGYDDKKHRGNVLRIKMDNSPSSSRDAPPPYQLPEHSILKSHLTGRPVGQVGPVGPAGPRARPQQWTISKRDSGEYQEEQLLFTNEHLQPAQPIITYGPGMYSAEDIQQDYQYSEAAKPGSYHPEYGYQRPYPEYGELTMIEPHTATGYEQPVAPAVIQGDYTQHQLPSYDAAVAQHYTGTYIIEEEKKPLVGPTPTDRPTAVRRSERPVRRRVSASYDYEDTDLYIDETPPARRTRHKHPKNAHNSSGGYRSSGSRPAPANGIESLIQASVLAEEPPTATEDAAVAGMLSIGEQRYATPQRTFGLAADASSTTSTPPSGARAGRAAAAPASGDEEPDDDDDEDFINEVHRDDEYVYPSLEMSSDDEEEWTATRRRRVSRTKQDAKGKGDKDESWSPRARLGRLVPRVRSGRAALRRECVRAALHHARHAAHAHRPLKPRDKNAKRAVIATKSKRPPPAPAPPPSNKNSHSGANKKLSHSGLRTLKKGQSSRNGSYDADIFSEENFWRNNINGYNEDADLNFTQLADKHGYSVETHEVTTEDGYILTIFRVNSENGTAEKRKTPLVFMPGMFDTADSWILAGAGVAMPYLTVDAGYDVWLGNVRGSIYAMKHILFDSDRYSKKFWNFSFHEHGVYDLRSTVDYVLNATGSQKLSYIGHSQGSTIFYVLTSELPEYNSKFDISISLAPTGYEYKMHNPVVVALTANFRGVKRFVDKFGIREFHSRKYSMPDKLFKILCEASPETCGAIIKMAVGGDPRKISRKTMQAIFGHYPDATSIKNLVHFSRLVNVDKFSKFDYDDPLKNLQVYGSAEAPEYDLSRIVCPVALITSKGDHYSTLRNVAKLRSKLPNVVHYTELGLDWGHGHYLWSDTIPTELAPYVFDLLKKYSS